MVAERADERSGYSPTQTAAYLKCAVYWWLSYKELGHGVIPRIGGRRAADLLVGRAAHAGLAQWYAPSAGTADIDAAVSSAIAVIGPGIQAMRLPGLLAEVVSEEAVAADVRRYLEGYAKKYSMEQEWTVLAVEQRFEKPCACIADLVVRYPGGVLAVVDHKFHSTKAKIGDLVEQFSMNLQASTLLRAATLHYGQPVRRFVLNAISKQARMTPDCYQREPIEYDDRLLEIAADMTQATWDAMHAATEESVQPNWEACHGRYGRCEYVPLCQSGWEPAVRDNLYVIKPPREDVSAPIIQHE